MVISFDVETSKAPKHFPWVDGSFLCSASIATEHGDLYSWLFNHPENNKPFSESIAEMSKILSSASRIVAHNIKFDLLWLMSLGIDFAPYKLYCTQVAEFILRGQEGGHGQLTLGQLSKDYGISDKIDKVKTFWDSGYETDEIPASILIPYCEQDCINTLAIYQRQQHSIVEQNLVPLCTLQFELIKTLAAIEYNGLLINKEKIERYSIEYGEEIRDVSEKIMDILRLHGGVHHPAFNINSGEHLSAALYGGCFVVEETEDYIRELKSGLRKPATRKTRVEVQIPGMGFQPLPKTELKKAGFYQTGLDVIKSLKCTTKEQRELLALITHQSRLVKLKSTYFDGLQSKMQKDGCVHPNMNQTIAHTGRLTSSNPNGQNFPRGSTGPVKELFITRYI